MLSLWNKPHFGGEELIRKILDATYGDVKTISNLFDTSIMNHVMELRDSILERFCINRLQIDAPRQVTSGELFHVKISEGAREIIYSLRFIYGWNHKIISLDTEIDSVTKTRLVIDEEV